MMMVEQPDATLDALVAFPAHRLSLLHGYPRAPRSARRSPSLCQSLRRPAAMALPEPAARSRRLSRLSGRAQPLRRDHGRVAAALAAEALEVLLDVLEDRLEHELAREGVGVDQRAASTGCSRAIGSADRPVVGVEIAEQRARAAGSGRRTAAGRRCAARSARARPRGQQNRRDPLAHRRSSPASSSGSRPAAGGSRASHARWRGAGWRARASCSGSHCSPAGAASARSMAADCAGRRAASR